MKKTIYECDKCEKQESETVTNRASWFIPKIRGKERLLCQKCYNVYNNMCRKWIND